MRLVGLGILAVVSILLFEYERLLEVVSADQSLELSTQEIPITETRVLFTGDVFLGRDVERRNTGELSAQPLEIFDTFSGLDAVVINFEAPIPQVHIPTPDFGMQFSVSARFLPTLAEAGVTHVSLANNHALDHSAAGFTHTQESFRAYDIKPFGHPTRFTSDSIGYIETPSHTLAAVGLHTLFGLPTSADIHRVMEHANATADMTVVYVHWGEEYQLQHSRAEEQLANTLVAAGADLIIGHHPHVVQGVDMIDDVVIFYSLGNTIFDQYFSINVQEGLLVELVLTDDEFELLLHPITSVGTPTVPRRMTDQERVAWLAALGKRSADSLQEMISEGAIHVSGPLRND